MIAHMWRSEDIHLVYNINDVTTLILSSMWTTHKTVIFLLC